MKKKIYFNGRFLTQSITGVQRTAYELLLSIDDLLDSDKIFTNKYQFILIYSGTLLNPIQLRNIKIEKRGFLTGNLWEQLLLPYYTWGNLLISMCMVSSLIKRKQIVIVHDASFKVNPQFFSFTFRTWYKFAISTLGKVARHIVTVSKFSRQELITKVGITANKISVIYNAADHMNRFGEADETFKKRIDKLKPFCLAVSSLSLNKNFTTLTKAFEKINFLNYNMVIAGGISNSLRKTELNKSIEYVGYVTNEQLKYLYSNATLFIFPSLYEGFGIPPLEAMICGCPVISSNTSSLPEVLGEGSQYFNPRNVDEIARAIEDILRDKETLNSLRAAGFLQVHKYSWNKSASQLFNLIMKYA